MTLTLWRLRPSGEVYIHDDARDTITGPLSQSEYMTGDGQLRPAGEITDTSHDDRTSEPGDFDPDTFDLYEGPYYRTYWTTSEAATILGVDRSRVWRMAHTRGLGQRVGKRTLLFSAADIDAMRTRTPGRPRTT